MTHGSFALGLLNNFHTASRGDVCVCVMYLNGDGLRETFKQAKDKRSARSAMESALSAPFMHAVP